MTDAETLYLVVAGFYLAECMFWVRTGVVVFSCQLGGRRQQRRDLCGALLRNPDGGVLLGNLLSLGQASLCQQWPVSLSPQGVYGFVSQAFSRDGRPQQPERFVRYPDLQSVEARGGNLWINGVLFARAAVPAFARFLAETIRQLAALPETARGPAIAAALARHLDATQVGQRLALFRRVSADLQITCSLLFFLVLVLPCISVQVAVPYPLGALLPAYFGLVFLAILQFREAHRILYPQDSKEHWKNTLGILVSPADALHARDKLSRHLLGEFSPLAVARVVWSPARFQDFAAEVWRDLAYPMLPLCPAPEDGPRETERWFRAQLRIQLGQFLADAGVNLDDPLRPPPPDEAGVRSYCPRCLAQYVLAPGTCADCGDRPLHTWGAAKDEDGN